MMYRQVTKPYNPHVSSRVFHVEVSTRGCDLWWLPLVAVALLVWAPSSVSASLPTPSIKEVRRLLRPPRGSLSVGRTNGGAIRNAAEVPLQGPGYAFFSNIQERKSNFATREMALLIPRVALAVRREYRGAVLGIGNISVEEGGPIGQSVSHRSGRDVDLGMYAFDRRGRRVNLRAFRKFERDGWDRQHKYRFDTQRNLALMVALLTDSKVEVQWIFVAEWLKVRLIAEAWEQAVDPAIIDRMESILHQPGDSNPHQDHYHVRIYCSVDDRRHGCIERGPIWDWVDLGDAAFEAYVSRLIEASRVQSTRWRRRVVQHLGLIRAEGAVPRLLELTGDSDLKVRTAAIEALQRVRSDDSFPTLITAARDMSDAGVAARVIRIALTLDHPAANHVARQILDGDTASPFSEDVRTGEVIRAALRRLGLIGTVHDFQRIECFLRSDTQKTKKAAVVALERLTGRSYRHRTAGVSAPIFWEDFRNTVHAHSRADWFIHSLRRAGLPLGKEVGMKDVPALIDAVRNKNTLVAHTASRLLTHITGHPIDPRARNARNTQRAWRTFWRHLLEFTGAEPAQRVARRPWTQ